MTTSTLKRFAAGALMSLSVAMAGVGMAAGNAQALPGGPVPLGSWPGCPPDNPSGPCRWCPGDPPVQTGNIRVYPVVWDNNVCHTYWYVYSGQGNVAAVVASNDGLAGGAIQALREHNLAGKVAVSGQDADLAAVICIAQGTQAMTVYKPIVDEAVRAAEEAVRLAKNEKPHADRTTSNGKIKVPTIMLTPVLVTKDNIKTTVVKDGFQKLKSINQGLPEDQQVQ